MQGHHHLSGRLWLRDPLGGNRRCPLLTPRLQPRKYHFVTSKKSEMCPLPKPLSAAAQGWDQGTPSSHLCLLSTQICSGAGGAGRPWNFPSSDFLILAASFVCAPGAGGGHGTVQQHPPAPSPPPHSCPRPGQTTTEQGRLLCFLSFFLTRGQEARRPPSCPLGSLHAVPCPPPAPPSWDRNLGPASGARSRL